MDNKDSINHHRFNVENSWQAGDPIKVATLPECGLIATRCEDGKVRFYDDEYPVLNVRQERNDKSR